MTTSPRFLIVDDEPEDRLLVRRLLGREWPRAQFVEAGDRSSLAQAVHLCAFDAVITEYELSWGAGLEVLREVKARRPHIPVVFFTSQREARLASEALTAGVEEYIFKSPVEVDRLVGAVREGLHRSRTRRLQTRSQVRPEALLDHLGAGVFRLSYQGDFLGANSALFRFLGFTTMEEVKEANLHDMFVRPEEGREVLLRTRENGRVDSLEVHLCRSDGTSVWGYLSEVLAAGEGDPVIDGLLVQATRGRPRKSPNTEDEWRRSALQNLPAIVFALDKDGNFVWLAGRGHEVLGLPEDANQVIGTSVFECFEDAPQLLGDISDALAGEEVVSSTEIGGKAVGIRCAPIHRSGGDIDGIVSVATVLHERGRMEISSTGTGETPG